MSQVNRQMQRTEATRAKLLAVARDLFSTHGFTEVPAEELVRQAGLTRGALYHHFGGKEGLFAALYEQIQREVTERIDSSAMMDDPWKALQAGCHEFLKSCLDPVVQRVVLLDAPAVMSWERWRQVDAEYGLGSLKVGLQAAAEAGAIDVASVDAAAYLLLGAMNEAAMWIARSPAPEQALAEAIATLDRMLEGLQPLAPPG